MSGKEETNPWLTDLEPTREESGGKEPGQAVWGFDPIGIRVAGEAAVGTVHAPVLAGVSLVGAHGGAGTTTLAMLTGLRDGGRWWPSGPIPNDVVVVARTHAHGLASARDAAMRYYAGQVSGVRLAGLVLVADQPSRRRDRVLSDAIDLTVGAYPACWRIGWVQSLRDGTWNPGAKLPAQIASAVDELKHQNERNVNVH